MTSESTFWDAVDDIRGLDPRYRREAYGFVMAALGATVRALPPERRADPARRHLSGAELLRGLIALARGEFGVLAPMVFETWGVRTSMDVAEIVFQLVEARQLSARPEDRREDFAGVALIEALREGVDLGLPQHPKPPRPSRPSGPSAAEP